jgi:hypothetical protein
MERGNMSQVDLEEVLIDVRDVDYTWFVDVIAYLDRDFDKYYFPRESAERLGEPDEETGDFYLIDGRVQAEADQIQVNGVSIEVWCADCGQLIVRPARKPQQPGSTGLSRD